MNVNVQVCNVIKYNCNAAAIGEHTAASDETFIEFSNSTQNMIITINNWIENRRALNLVHGDNLGYWFIMYSPAVTLVNCNFYRSTGKMKTVDKIRQNENFWINIIMIHYIKPFYCQWFTISFCIHKKFCRICVHWPALFIFRGGNLSGIFYFLIATVSLPPQFIFYANSLIYSLLTWHEEVLLLIFSIHSVCLTPSSSIPLANVKFHVKSQWKFLGIKKPKKCIKIFEGKSVLFLVEIALQRNSIANCHENLSFCYILF